MARHWELETETGIFFWGGVFSNWYKSTIELPMLPGDNPLKFNCVEQYMMAHKALRFGDLSALQRVMDESNPSKQKAIGKEVYPFDKDAWSNEARDLVYPAVYTKFNTNQMLKDLILSTGDKMIVEASPYDKIWGIGVGTDSATHVDDVVNWQGTNWLGQLCMRARDEIFTGTNGSFKKYAWSDDPTRF